MSAWQKASLTVGLFVFVAAGALLLRYERQLDSVDLLAPPSDPERGHEVWWGGHVNDSGKDTQ
jgi:hypothetical protein